MLKLFFKKERQLETLIFNYLDEFGLIQKEFSTAIDACLQKGVSEDFLFLVDQTHKFESRGDEIRDSINLLMYSKALIPESREDIMNLIEAIDGIPRHFEQILHMIHTQKLVIPEIIRLDAQELIQVSLESCDLMVKQVEAMLKKSTAVRTLLSQIDQNESQCDHIERRMIIKIFDSDLDPFQKLQLKEMVLVMGDISDQAERVSKRVNIIALKRRV